MSDFPAAVVDAVLAHMNDDHTGDNLVIVRAFGAPDATEARMIGLDGDAGLFAASTTDGEVRVRVPWPAGPITERAEIRREIVALFDEASALLGLPPREQH